MIALDLFAGTGWGVACQALGIEEYGVEIMPEAVATRDANGMTTLYRDVWEGLSIPTDVVEAYEHDIKRLGHDEARERYAARSGGDPLNVGAPTAERVTVAEAAALQSYPPGFVWDVEVNGKPITKTKTFLQIGNAVPPLLAAHILEGFLS